MKCDNTNHSASNNAILPETDYIKLRQGSKITSLYTLLPLPREVNLPEQPAGKADALLKLDELENGTFKITRGEGCIYIDNYRDVIVHSKGGYRLNTYRLLDFLTWQLDGKNRSPDGKGGYTDPLCTQLTLPLEQYIRCCGYEGAITVSKRKDTQKELQKDLRLLCATQIGWDDGSAVRILDAGCVQNGQMIATFSERMADYLLHHCFSMWYPLGLMHLSGRSLLAYSLGRSMALHSSIIKNQVRGTDGTLSVRSLLKYCPSLPTPEEVRTRNGNYRQAIIRPFTEALDKLLEMDIIDWDWKFHKGEEFPEKHNDFLREYVEYSMTGMPEGTWNFGQ